MQFEIGGKRGGKGNRSGFKGKVCWGKFFFFFFSLFPEREAGHKRGGIEARDDIGISFQREETEDRTKRERERRGVRKPKRALGEKGREFRYRRYSKVQTCT